MSKTLRAFSLGKFSWTEMICVKKLTLCNSGCQVKTLREAQLTHGLTPKLELSYWLQNRPPVGSTFIT